MTVVWLTGLSGAGKTTVACALEQFLKDCGVAAHLLDGDAVRAEAPTGFSREERMVHIARVAERAAALERQGIVVIVALISPYREARQRAREVCRDFIEVFVSTPLPVCEQRDPKGLYRKARSGEIAHFTGISDPYEAPEHPDVVVDTSTVSVAGAVEAIVDCLRRKGVLT